jgi:hypothetical protein
MKPAKYGYGSASRIVGFKKLFIFFYFPLDLKYIVFERSLEWADDLWIVSSRINKRILSVKNTCFLKYLISISSQLKYEFILQQK